MLVAINNIPCLTRLISVRVATLVLGGSDIRALLAARALSPGPSPMSRTGEGLGGSHFGAAVVLVEQIIACSWVISLICLARFPR